MLNTLLCSIIAEYEFTLHTYFQMGISAKQKYIWPPTTQTTNVLQILPHPQTNTNSYDINIKSRKSINESNSKL